MATATASSRQERKGAHTFKGNPLTLVGPQLNVGDKAPDFTALNQDFKPVTLSESAGQVRLISVVPSLDTGICDAQTKRFNEEATTSPKVKILTVSMESPFTQKRWCGASGVDKVQVLSDHRDASFGPAYGVLIKEMGVLARSIFIVDGSGTIRYIEYVPEFASHPNYDAALAALKKVAA